MLSGKKVSLKNVISKVYSDLNIKDEDHYTKIIEWLGEALSKIKVHDQLESVSTTLCVKNHKTELPCDLVYLEEVGHNGRQLTKTSASSLEQKYNSNMVLYNQYSSIDINKINNKCFELGLKYTYPDGQYFLIENGWFKTSFNSGDVDIVYKRFPLDNEGFPLIPEEESFRSALFWYVAWKYFFIKKIEASGNDFNKFHTLSLESEQKWHWYCGQSGSEALMPDLFTLENIKRNFISLVPKIDSFDNFYNNLNK